MAAVESSRSSCWYELIGRGVFGGGIGEPACADMTESREMLGEDSSLQLWRLRRWFEGLVWRP